MKTTPTVEEANAQEAEEERQNAIKWMAEGIFTDWVKQRSPSECTAHVVRQLKRHALKVAAIYHELPKIK